MRLRDYQIKLLDEVRALMKSGVKSIIIQSATGSGKTVLTAEMISKCIAKDMNCWFINHRRELINQSSKTFANWGLPHGIVAAGYKEEIHRQAQVCSIGTLPNRTLRLKRPHLIIWDECHHIAARTWERIFIDYPDAFHIGLTASPCRLDGKGLGKYFKKIVNGPSVSDLIDQGYLSKYSLYAPAPKSITDGVHTKMGDFVKSELNKVMNKPKIVGDAIEHYRQLCNGKRALVFAVSIEHSLEIARQFNLAGINARHVDGETKTKERDEAIQDFISGKIKVITNVDLFSEGVDLPSLEAVILLRPTTSVGLYLQQVGRALRVCEGKERAIILDHAANVVRHGLPDEEREWSLDGIKKKQTSAPIKICPSCYGAQKPFNKSCVYCGLDFGETAKTSPREVEQCEGTLIEVDKDYFKKHKRKEQGAAQTLQELIELGKQRGYKNAYAWANHLIRARQSKRR